MHSFKIVSNKPKTREEQEKLLKEIIERARNNGSKYVNPIVKETGGVGDKTDIVIPDINTAFAYSQMAVAIVNQSSGPIHYGYTYNGTQKGYYKYTVEQSDRTGNGMGADFLTHHCMIIEIPINDGSGDSGFFVPAVTKYDDLYLKTTLPTLNVYYTRAKADNPPNFLDKVGGIGYKDLQPDIVALDLVFNFHVTITCFDNTIRGTGRDYS